MINIQDVADVADMIIAGYAFTRDGEWIRVLNLLKPSSAAVLSEEGELISTNMDDIEIAVVLDYYHRNKKYMEAA